MMKKLISSFGVLLLSACSLIPKPELNITDAELNPVSQTMRELQAKPGPK